MPTIAVINPHIGSGKSTLAVQIAVWLALEGKHVLLGGNDRQRSADRWLSLRNCALVTIAAWPADLARALRSTPELHVVIDTPGQITLGEVDKKLSQVDVVVIPVGPSLRHVATATDFLKEVLGHPRVVDGACRVAVIGMGWPSEMLNAWRRNPIPRQLSVLTVISKAAGYPISMASGRGVFELDGSESSGERHEWKPLLEWIDGTAQGLQGTPRLTKQLHPASADAPTLAQSAPSVAEALFAHHAFVSSTLRSQESFVETVPPDSLSASEILAARASMLKAAAARNAVRAPRGHTAEYRDQGNLEAIPTHTVREVPTKAMLQLKELPPVVKAKNSNALRAWLKGVFRKI